MHIRITLLIIFTYLATGIFSQNNLEAYVIFDKEGKQLNFGQMAAELKKADVVLFGELHNNPVVHWLQLELTKYLFEEKGQSLMLGAEMFEADNQLVLDEYLHGLIKAKHLSAEAKVWNNYETDYRPLVDFAKDHELPFIATNVPRRYASMIAGGGFESLKSLSTEAKNYMAPLPITVDMDTPGYQEIIGMSHGGDAHSGQNFVNAQAIKDATMAHFINENFKRNLLFLHFNGDYHSSRYGGIYWHLRKSSPKLNIMTISSTEAESMKYDKDYKGLGDFLIVVPENMTKTY